MIQQSMSHRGFTLQGHHFGYSGFGQFVTDPLHACSLAIRSGTVGAVRLLTSRAASVLTLLSRQEDAFAARLGILARSLNQLAAPNGSDSDPPSKEWTATELNTICTGIATADSLSQASTDTAIVAARNELIEAAEQIQAQLQVPRSKLNLPLVLGVAVGAVTVTVGLVWLLGRR